MPVPDFSNPRPAYLQIADDLRREVQAGRLQPGDQLPSRRTLAERYGVAAETIRRSLDELVHEGLIGTHSTRGTFVLKESTEPQGIDVEIREIRAELAKISRRLEALEAPDSQ